MLSSWTPVWKQSVCFETGNKELEKNIRKKKINCCEIDTQDYDLVLRIMVLKFEV